MRAVKAVRQNHRPTPQILFLLETFPRMVDDCIRIGLETGATSRNKLCRACYRLLKPYGLHTWYSLYAVSVAAGILRNYRYALRRGEDARRPRARKLMAEIGSQAFKIEDDRLRVPIRSRKFEFIPLKGHTRTTLFDPALKMGSVTLTASTFSISFSKEVAEIDPMGYMGIDRNVDNLTLATSFSENRSYNLSKATRIKSSYRAVKSHFKRNDARLRRKVFRKYGIKQRNRIDHTLHRASKDIVSKAKDERLGIAMERLTGMRRLYRRGNGQGRGYRARMNSWSYAELQRQIEYKARWEGIKVIYVPARKTSSTCAICGSEILECAERKVWGPKCRTLVDRDVNAARNILARGLRFGPVAPPSEAMVREPAKVIPRVDGGELIQRA
jgi:putative transposase